MEDHIRSIFDSLGFPSELTLQHPVVHLEFLSHFESMQQILRYLASHFYHFKQTKPSHDLYIRIRFVFMCPTVYKM